MRTETLAGVAAADGRPGQAARLLGAALADSERVGAGAERERGARQHSGGVAYDWEARAVTRVFEAARRELGTNAWEAALAEGRTLTVADALASAKEWTTVVDERAAPGDEDGVAEARRKIGPRLT